LGSRPLAPRFDFHEIAHSMDTRAPTLRTGRE
jgi:hypothetical protein